MGRAPEPGDSLVRYLLQDPLARWWDEQGVRDGSPLPISVAHPDVGLLRLDLQVVASHHLDQHLLVHTAEPGSETVERLSLLADRAGRRRLTG